jgi:N utilization substance protein B
VTATGPAQAKGPRRRGARKIALDVLYEHELTGSPVEEILARHSDAAAAEYAAVLVDGVRKHQKELDALIESRAEHWELDRMPLIDLALLRISLFEMLHTVDVPLAVTINEAVELAKRYSTEESGRFINGMLSRVAEDRG